MAFTLNEAAALLNEYPSQRLASFQTLVDKRKRVDAANAVLTSLIASEANPTTTNAQLGTLEAERAALGSAIESLRSLNVTRTNAQGVVNTSLNINPSLVPATNPLIGPTGGAGPTGAASTVPGPTGPQPTPAGAVGSLQVNAGTPGASGISPSSNVGSVLVSRGTGNLPTYSQAFPITLTGISVPTTTNFDLVVGDNALYTVPTGKRLLLNGVSVSNNSGSTITIIQTVRVGSTTYRLLTLGNLATGTGVTNYQYTMIFEPGEIVGFNTNVAGLYVRMRGFLYDSGCPLRSVKKLDTWSVGDNVVYTVPTGASAMSIGYVPYLQDSLSFRGAYHNTSGATISNLRVYTRPSGQSVQNRYSITGSINVSSVGNNASLGFGNNFVLAAGDSVLVNTTSTGAQSIFINIIEFTS